VPAGDSLAQLTVKLETPKITTVKAMKPVGESALDGKTSIMSDPTAPPSFNRMPFAQRVCRCSRPRQIFHLPPCGLRSHPRLIADCAKLTFV